MSKRDEYVEKLKQQLDEINSQISSLEGQVNETKDEAKTKLDGLMSEVRGQAAAVQDKIGELKAAGDKNWKEHKAEAEKVRDALVHSFHYLKSQLQA